MAWAIEPRMREIAPVRAFGRCLIISAIRITKYFYIIRITKKKIIISQNFLKYCNGIYCLLFFTFTYTYMYMYSASEEKHGILLFTLKGVSTWVLANLLGRTRHY